ncbi:hypothetical protein Sjap_005189 [Stephania japonica]|uniref:Uncharacterized protein n=1 Tax=Stephania japonica TaxID=461633 RepID=A0AAP0PLL7_9MAGN
MRRYSLYKRAKQRFGSIRCFTKQVQEQQTELLFILADKWGCPMNAIPRLNTNDMINTPQTKHKASCFHQISTSRLSC